MDSLPIDLAKLSERELYELRQKAIDYLKQHQVQSRIENVLNTLCIQRPEDVFGYLASGLQEYCQPPAISRLEAYPTVNSDGCDVTKIDVYVSYQNKTKVLASALSSHQPLELQATKVDELQPLYEQRKASIGCCCDHITGPIQDLLRGENAGLQLAVDESLSKFADDLVAKDKARDEEVFAGLQQSIDVESGKQTPATKSKSGKESKMSVKKDNKKGGRGASIEVIANDPPELFPAGSEAVSVTSKAICLAGAALKEAPVYQHIAELRSKQDDRCYSLPLPLVTVFEHGKAAPGKLALVKEFMLFPSERFTFHEGIGHIARVCRRLKDGIYISSKQAVAAKNVTGTGAMLPTLEKLEQALDMLQDAITGCGLTPGDDVRVALAVGARQAFDLEKGRYEIATGLAKSPADMVPFYDELLKKYPSIRVIIDPIRKEDRDAWMTLVETISDRCLVVGDEGVKCASSLLAEQDDTVLHNGSCTRLDKRTTVSDIIALSRKYKDSNKHLILTATQETTNDTLLVDLGIGLNLAFVRVGGMFRGEATLLINHCIQTERELDAMSLLKTKSQVPFEKLDRASLDDGRTTATSLIDERSSKSPTKHISPRDATK